MGALYATSFSSAQTIKQLNQSISSTTDKIQKLEEEIKQSENNLEKTRSLKITLSNLIYQLDITRKKLENEIRLTATKVDNTDLKIKQLDAEILYKENSINSREAALGEAVRAIYEYDGHTLPEVAASGLSFSGLWSDLEAIGQFNDSMRANTEVLKGLKSDLENKQGVKQTEKKNLITLKTELGDRKKITEQNKKEKAVLLAQTKNKEIAFQKLLKEKRGLKDAFEQELRDYEAQLKFSLDPTSIPPRGTKVFATPLDSMANIPKKDWLNLHIITQLFGKTVDSVRLYSSGTHNGTDFRASVGTPVKAMAAGTVAGVGDTDPTCPGASFGKWIFIRYQNGLASTYGHLSLITASPGDSVSAGTLVGYSGNTGYSTGPHLHVSVYANDGVSVRTLKSKICGGRTYTLPIAAFNAYLDPMDYL